MNDTTTNTSLALLAHAESQAAIVEGKLDIALQAAEEAFSLTPDNAQYSDSLAGLIRARSAKPVEPTGPLTMLQLVEESYV